jgi:hypothetical protein
VHPCPLVQRTQFISQERQESRRSEDIDVRNAMFAAAIGEPRDNITRESAMLLIRIALGGGEMLSGVGCRAAPQRVGTMMLVIILPLVRQRCRCSRCQRDAGVRRQEYRRANRSSTVNNHSMSVVIPCSLSDDALIARRSSVPGMQSDACCDMPGTNDALLRQS